MKQTCEAVSPIAQVFLEAKGCKEPPTHDYKKGGILGEWYTVCCKHYNLAVAKFGGTKCQCT